MRHLGFILLFLIAAFVCLILSLSMSGDSVCMFDPTSAGCARAEAARALHFQLYSFTALAFAVASIALHLVKNRFVGIALSALAVGPFLSLLLPIA